MVAVVLAAACKGPEGAGGRPIAERWALGGDAPAGAERGGEMEGDGEDGSIPVHGQLSARYRGRWAGGEEDHDLFATLFVDVGEAGDRVRGHFLGTVSWDVDGGPDAGAAFVFHSLADTYDSRVHGRVFEAYVDVREVGPAELLRVGRQIDHRTPELAWFDGVAAQTEARGEHALRWGAYAGVPVHLYESSAGGDAIGGLWGEGAPWEGGRARVDWMHLEDERRGEGHSDDLLGLHLWQALGRRARVETAYTHLNGDPRDVRAAATWFDAEEELVLQASHYRLLETQRELSLEVDPFFATLFELFPYHQSRLLASKGLGEHLAVESGLDVRRVDDEGDEGQFNRDFERVWLTATVREVLPHHWTLAATGERWEGDAIDIATWGADLSRDFGKSLQAAVGSQYALYRYDLYQDRERDDVRVWYLRLRHRASGRRTFRLSYEFEDDDLERYHVLELGAAWRF